MARLYVADVTKYTLLKKSHQFCASNRKYFQLPMSQQKSEHMGSHVYS